MIRRNCWPLELKFSVRSRPGSASFFGAAFMLKVGDQFSRGAILSFATIGLGQLIMQRVVYRRILTRGLADLKFTGRNAILIADDASGGSGELLHTLIKHGFQLEQQFMLPVAPNSKKLNDFISDIVGYVRGSNVEEIIVGVDAQRWSDLKQLLSGLRVLPLPVSLIPVGTVADVLSYPTHVIGDTVCIELHRGPLGAFERGFKRSIDVLSAVAGLLLLLPLLTITAVLIKLDSPGPVLFRQKRCGFNGRQFQILKFRSMSVLEDGPTVRQAAESDIRVTRIGKWLRRTSIDELPQLLNVLSGTMSLVGPRPHALAHDNHFDKVVRNYAFRHHVKPGLTGWAQVNGHRGPTPTVADIQRRVQFDLWYIDNWSLRLDFLIIIKTIVEVMRSRNAY
jgi:Undecaprenyl-phosphate glucose phosphotransferase